MKHDNPNSRWQEGAWVPVADSKRAGDAPELLPSVPIDRAIATAATEISDVKLALELTDRYVEANVDMTCGDKITELETEEKMVHMRLDVAMQALSSIDIQLASQPIQIPASQQNGGVNGPSDPNTETPPRHWQLRDKLTASVTTFGVAALSIASYAGIQASLADAQLPIFETRPHLTYMLAVLAPASGLAVKLIGNVFLDPANRDRYRKGVAIIGGLAFFAWVPMFASLFEGLSGVFSPFDEPKHLLGWGFNTGHIIAEALIAAGLFAQLDAVMLKYAPSEKMDNPARPPLLRARNEQQPVVETLTLRLGKIRGALRRYRGLRDSTKVLVETGIRQRMNQKPSEGLL